MEIRKHRYTSNIKYGVNNVITCVYKAVEKYVRSHVKPKSLTKLLGHLELSDFKYENILRFHRM